MELPQLRSEYDVGTFDEADLAPDPLTQFERWFLQWRDVAPTDPGAMALATVDDDGRPTVRNVLLRVADEGGFGFFTNLDSRKGRHLRSRPVASLLFSWLSMHRQVIVEGDVEPIGADEADAYFASRPRDSQLSAWASAQSEVLPARAHLEARVMEVADRFAGGPVPRPPNWGGYRLVPASVEFWQGRPSRLHDRLRFDRDPGSTTGWRVVRLNP